MDKLEVRRFVRAAIFDKLMTMEGKKSCLDMSEELADAVMTRLEALDATVLERPSPIVMPYEAV